MYVQLYKYTTMCISYQVHPLALSIQSNALVYHRLSIVFVPPSEDGSIYRVDSKSSGSITYFVFLFRLIYNNNACYMKTHKPVLLL